MNTKLIISFVMFALSAWPSLAADKPAQALLCVACHGEAGIAPADFWPNLAGQQHDYLLNEMKAFRDGSRFDPTMSASVKGFSDKQLAALAAYYSSLPAPSAKPGKVNEAGRQVRARCVSCHGMDGNTVTSHWPNLAGQKAAYLEKQLRDFKDGTRPGPIMQVIASELTDQQIKDVAEYYSQL